MYFRAFIPLTLSLLLAACLPPKALPSSEVLERTALASQKLSSVAFSVSMSGTFVGILSHDHMGGRMDLQGVLHDQGNALDASFSGSLTGAMSGSPAAFGMSGRVIAFNQRELYARLDTLRLKPDISDVPMQHIELLLGTWWHMEGNAASGAVVLSTSDPTFLKAQTQAISVTEDKGFETVKNRYNYHYTVTLDREKFMKLLHGEQPAVDLEDLHATGDVWIDAETFFLTRAIWKIDNLPTDDGTLNAVFTVDLSHHNEAEPVQVPATSKELNPSLLAPLFHPDLTLPLVEEGERDDTDTGAS